MKTREIPQSMAAPADADQGENWPTLADNYH